MTKVAIILPIYLNDRNDFLRLAIESVLSQRNVTFELIIAIDGTIDNDKWLLLKEFDKEVTLLQFEKHRGLPETLNSAIKYCLKKKYDFIARMDADDICLHDRLNKQLEYLNNTPVCDILGTEATVINTSGEIIGYKKLPKKISYFSLFWRCNIIHPSVVFRASFFKKFGLYNTYYEKSQDYELWIRAIKAGATIHNLKENLFLLRYEDGIVNRRKKEQKFNIKLKLKYLPFYIKFVSIIPNIFIALLPNQVLTKYAKNIGLN